MVQRHQNRFMVLNTLLKQKAGRFLQKAAA
jgi:hypothetical protein